MKFRKNTNNRSQKLDQLHQLYLNAYNKGQYKAAFEYAVQGHKLLPASIKPLNDAMVSAVYAKMWSEAVIYGKKILHRDPNYLNAIHGLAQAYYHLEDYENCQIQGNKALQLLDKKVLDGIKLPELPTIQPKLGKKIISFSLFGADPKYIESAVINAEIAPYIYPDWICRFYLDDSVPKSAIQRLRNLNAEVIVLGEEFKHIPGTMWRFLALDDESVSHVIFRDADSVISSREAAAVNEWLISGKYFHTIRDSGSHTELVLAGLWGAITGILPNVKSTMEQYIMLNELDSRFADQYFLRQCFWKYIRQSLCGHDSVFHFMDSKPFPTSKQAKFCVGDRETTISFQVSWDGITEGSKVKWQLFSQIKPLLKDDLSYDLFDNERLICEYETPVINGVVRALIPKRYYQGLKTGESRIAILR